MDNLCLDGKVAIVTGAGRGLGRAYARLLAERGARVVVNDLGGDLAGAGGDGAPAEQVAEEIRRAGGEAVANADSVASEEGGRAIVRQALETFGGAHIIVNNAGNFTASRPFLETSTASFESLWQVHVMGTVHLIRAAWQHLNDQGYGRIINIGSQGGYYGHRGKFEYATVKSGIHGLTLSLAMEGAPNNVHVNLVAPGAGTRAVLSWGAAEQFGGDNFKPELVAPLVLWLAHEDCPANGECYSGAAGNFARVVVAETRGYQSRGPTAETIEQHLEAIRDVGDLGASNLMIAESAVAHGTNLINRFATSPG